MRLPSDLEKKEFHLKLGIDLIVTYEQAKFFGRLFTFYMRYAKNNYYYAQFYLRLLHVD